MKKHIEQLDSFRGLGASIVFICHMPIIAAGVPLILVKLLTLIGVLNGHSFLMEFFVISGFVLSIPFFEKNNIEYVPFLIRRIFRIYLPYLIPITFAIILSQLFLTRKISGISDYIDNQWKTTLNGKLILEHLYFIGNIHSDAFNGVIWSLIHELRISLIFPFVVLLVKRINWKISVIICCALSCAAYLNYVFNFQTRNGYLNSYFDTLHYLSIFIIGSLLAKHRFEVVNYFSELKPIKKVIFFLISFFLFNLSGTTVFYLYHITGLKFLNNTLMIIEYGASMGGVGFLIIAMGSSKAKKILLNKTITFLGKISYSLYLYHPLLLLSCIHLFYNILPLWTICIIAILLTIPVSYTAWRFVEVPSMRLGKNIANRLIIKQNYNLEDRKKLIG